MSNTTPRMTIPDRVALRRRRRRLPGALDRNVSRAVGRRFRPTDGVDRCECGCKYWTDDRCIDCGDRFRP